MTSIDNKLPKDKQTKTTKSPTANYSALAVVFLVVGAGLIIPESTRTTGLPFIILGLVFFVLSKPKNSQK